MRSLVYIFISVFFVVLFSSCAVRENIQAKMEHRRLLKETQFSLDSIKKIASAYGDDHYGHTYEFCNWQNRKTPSFVFFLGTKSGGGATHFADGSVIKEYNEEEAYLNTSLDSCEYQTLVSSGRGLNIAYVLFYGAIERPVWDICVTKDMDEFFAKK